jgi:hypothetical protein
MFRRFPGERKSTEISTARFPPTRGSSFAGIFILHPAPWLRRLHPPWRPLRHHLLFAISDIPENSVFALPETDLWDIGPEGGEEAERCPEAAAPFTRNVCFCSDPAE